jgi:hypothetical protein
MSTYQVTKVEGFAGQMFDSIQRTDDDGKIWSIPADPANSDYQAYLAAQANSTES